MVLEHLLFGLATLSLGGVKYKSTIYSARILGH